MKRALILIGTLALLFPALAPAATIAVIDSGTDFEHKAISGHQFKNPLEIPGNRVDDDQNGKVDDTVGWNFVDKYSRVFYREHLNTYEPMVYRLLEVLARRQAGKSSAADKAFWDRYVASLDEEQKIALSNHVNSFGQYIHGTHVAGIVLEQSPNAKILSGRVFADEPPPEFALPSAWIMGAKEGSGWSWSNWLYKIMAAVGNGVFDQTASYINEMDARVANYSLGVPMQMIAKAILGAKGVKEPTPEQLSEETQRMFKQYEPRGKKWMAMSPNTLFVVAAGNDGSDNDVLPVFPANVEAPNAIRVAASLDYAGLGDFSNYGKTTVDVAAPGVAILSPVPSLDNKERLPLSGTSMAAPFVTGVAGNIHDINPNLTPAEIKSILMSTVDKKPWLVGKVISEGVVNPERAYAAAKKTLTTSLKDSVSIALTSVPDRPVQAAPAATHSMDPLDNLFDDNGLTEMAKQMVF